MRRIRPQFKPNLGPRAAARPNDSASKATAQRPLQPIPPNAVGGKVDSATHPAGSDSKSSEAAVVVAASAVSAGAAGLSGGDVTSGCVLDKPSTGARSPRKLIHDGPKSPATRSKSPVVLPKSPMRSKSPARSMSPVMLPKSPVRSKSPAQPMSPPVLPKSPVRSKSPGILLKSPLRPRSPAALLKSPVQPKSPAAYPKSPAAIQLKFPKARSKSPVASSVDQSDSAVALSASPSKGPVAHDSTRISSPDRSAPPTHTAAVSGRPDTSGTAVKEVDKSSSAQGKATNTVKTASGPGTTAKPAAKPVIRSARARFKPNLVDPKKRKEKPAVVDKPTAETEHVHDKNEDQGQKPESVSRPGVSVMETDDAPVVHDANDASHTSEDTTDGAPPPPPESVTSDCQPAGGEEEVGTAAAAVVVEEQEEEEVVAPQEEGEEVGSEAGTSAGSSDVADGAQLDTGGPESSAASDDLNHKKSGKKARRSKPVLPSTEKPADRGKMKMSDFIYWNPARNPMTKKENKRVVLTPPAAEEEEAEGKEGEGEQEEEEGEEVPVVQLKLDANNQIILNEESMTVAGKKSDSQHQPTEIVEEDEDRFITSHSFRDKAQRSKKWSKKETERFFGALRLVGTDFFLMAKMFPSRSRKDLKNKFSKEDKQNRALIDKALQEHVEFTKNHFEKAEEEDAAEIRHQKALAEEKKKKQAERGKKERKEKAEEEEEEAEEMEGDEEVEKKLEADEREERKENSRKRRNGKLYKDEAKFSGYKRRRAEAPQSGLTTQQEVVEILVNMSQVAAVKKREAARGEDTTSETPSSVVSEPDATAATSTTTSPFVPRVARPVLPPQLSTSTQVLIDPEVSVTQWTVPEEPDAEGTPTLNRSNPNPNPSNDQETGLLFRPGVPRSSFENAASGLTGVGEASSVCVSAPAVDGAGGVGTQVASLSAGSADSMVDISAFIEGLQAQASTPVDVVLVEQNVEGQGEGWVHVYLVPRITTLHPEGGPQQNSLQGGAQNSLQAVNSLQGGAHHSLQGGAQNSLQGGAQNSLQGGAQNSLQGGAQNSLQGGAQNSLQGGAQNSLQGGPHNSLQGGAQNSLQVGAQNSLQGGLQQNSLQGGAQNSLQGGPQNSLQGGLQQNSLQGGAQNSLQGGAHWMQTAGGAVAANSAVVGGAGPLLEGHDRPHFQASTAAGTRALPVIMPEDVTVSNIIHSHWPGEVAARNSIQTAVEPMNSDVGVGMLTEGGDRNSLLWS
ncbi:uncharacterized protein LOC143286505 [Babylonia areolata]|uniref:uncharacterized protein LOC143286505 n=1 Tax=Babylonia areolata TaxID=304850 RepID=UPI003FD6988E